VKELAEQGSIIALPAVHQVRSVVVHTTKVVANVFCTATDSMPNHRTSQKRIHAEDEKTGSGRQQLYHQTNLSCGTIGEGGS